MVSVFHRFCLAVAEPCRQMPPSWSRWKGRGCAPGEASTSYRGGPLINSVGACSRSALAIIEVAGRQRLHHHVPFGRPDMTLSSNQHERRNGKTSFWLSGWAMLLVVLLSAAPTGGPPKTRLVGSAFDSATVWVALGAKKPRPGVPAASIQKRKLPQSVASSIAEVPLITSAIELPGTSGLSLFATPRQAISTPRAFAKAHPTRAPPNR